MQRYVSLLYKGVKNLSLMLKFVAMQHFCDKMSDFYRFCYRLELRLSGVCAALYAGFGAYAELVLEAFCEVARCCETYGVGYF